VIADADTHFHEVAQALANSAPAGWTKAKVSTAIEADSLSTSEYDYVDADGREQWFDPDAATAAAVGRNLRALRTSAIEQGQAAWSRCTFVLSNDGSFKFDVKYDD
jgi:hypothetical protein